MIRFLLILLLLGNYPVRVLAQQGGALPDSAGRRIDTGMYVGADSYTRIVSIHSFYFDTLNNDSYFKANYMPYMLPKPQLQPDSETAYLYQHPVMPRDNAPKSWIFLVISAILILLLFIKFNFSKLFQNALASVVSRKAATELVQDRYSPRWLFTLFANLFFVMVLTLWAYNNFVTLVSPYTDAQIGVFALIFIMVLSVYLVKFVVHFLAGILLQVSDAVQTYLINVSVLNLLSGIVLFLVTLFMLYSPFRGNMLLQVSVVTLVSFVVFRYIRALAQTLQFFRYNYLYLILYLCALEITPWFLMIKYLKNYL